MTASRRTSLYAFLLLALLILTACWSVTQLSNSRAQAIEASNALASSHKLINQIKQLRQRPSLAGAKEMQLTDLTQLIEQAAQSAGLSRQQLVRIWPEPARRVDDSPYKQKPTQILLESVTLEQLLKLLTGLTQDQQLTATSLRLSMPRSTAPHQTSANAHRPAAQGTNQPNRWSAELTVSYFIYTPPAAAPTVSTLVQTDQVP